MLFLLASQGILGQLVALNCRAPTRPETNYVRQIKVCHKPLAALQKKQKRADLNVSV